MNIKSLVEPFKNKYFLAFAIASIVTKIALGKLGPNADLESWQIVGDIISKGQSIYDNTARYNYGPFWGYICGLVAITVKLLGATNVYTPYFHLIIAAILGIFDALIAAIIYKHFNKTAGLFFLINPISMVLSGSHSQFDNVAIFFGLLGWIYYTKEQNKKVGIYLLGISMIFKHIFLFFPIWMVMHEYFNKKSSFKKNITKIAQPFLIYLIFIAGFLLELVHGFMNIGDVAQGILKNVIMYRGFGLTLGGIITNLIIPPEIFDLSMYVPIFKGYMFFYLVYMLLVGFFVIKNKLYEDKFLVPIYILSFFVFSFSDARQYYAIPLIAVFIFYKRIESFIFVVLGSIYVFATALLNLSNYYPSSLYMRFLGLDIPMFPWHTIVKINYLNGQTWALLLLLGILFIPKLNVVSKRAYEITFLLLFVCLGGYWVLRNVNDNALTVIKSNDSEIIFKCSKQDRFIEPVYKVTFPENSDKQKGIDRAVKCPEPFPLF